MGYGSLRRAFTTCIVVAGLLIVGCSSDGSDSTTTFPETRSPPTSTGEAAAVDSVVDGIGDPYYPTLGNTGYDVDHYDIDLTFDPPSTISATVAVDAVATSDLAVFNLDFAGFDITQLTVNDDDAPYARHDGELTIQPTQPITSGDRFTVDIAYAGTPVPGYSAAVASRVGWLVSTSGQQYVAAQPDGAHTWLPVNDHPRDKATYTYRITAPSTLVAAANGVLTTTDTHDDATTWTWDMTHHMASHLATIVIGNYQLITDPTASELTDVEIRHLLTPDLADEPPPVLEQLGEMITVLEEFFGPYPFDAYGIAIIDPHFSPALETQTLSLFSPMLLDERVMVHELAHQWFGNHVSVDRWQDLWISEGFATYAEWLWIEATQGQDAMHDAITTDEEMLWMTEPPPAAQPPPGDLYTLAVYQVGARALHDIRLEVGDDTFFEILTTFVDRYGGGTATADDLITLTSQLADRDLTPIFDDWLNDTDLPDLVLP